jgi:hypothetical protein
MLKLKWDALKKINILLDEPIIILMNHSLSSLNGKGNPCQAHSKANGVEAKADDALGLFSCFLEGRLRGI